jgi:hypothetical protein
MTVRGQQRCVTDAETRVHHFILGARRGLARLIRLGWRVFEPHERYDLGTKRATVELDRFLASTVKEQIRLNLHDVSF